MFQRKSADERKTDSQVTIAMVKPVRFVVRGCCGQSQSVSAEVGEDD